MLKKTAKKRGQIKFQRLIVPFLSRFSKKMRKLPLGELSFRTFAGGKICRTKESCIISTEEDEKLLEMGCLACGVVAPWTRKAGKSAWEGPKRLRNCFEEVCRGYFSLVSLSLRNMQAGIL